jgi:hypothetical protein
MKARVEVRKLTHCMYVPDLEAGHTSSGEAMTMGRKTYVVLSMALLMKLRSGRTRCYKVHVNIQVTSRPAGWDSTRIGAISFGI